MGIEHFLAGLTALYASGTWRQGRCFARSLVTVVQFFRWPCIRMGEEQFQALETEPYDFGTSRVVRCFASLLVIMISSYRWLFCVTVPGFLLVRETRRLKLWDINTGRELQQFTGHTNTVASVAPLADLRRALTGGWDGAICLWNLKTGQELRRFKGHAAEVWSVAVLPDGRRALSGSTDRTLRLWDIETGDELRRFDGHADRVMSTMVLPDGRRAFTGSTDRTLRLWDIETGTELRRFEGHTSDVMSISILQNGARAISAARDNTLRQWLVSGLPSSSNDNYGYTTARVALLGDAGVGKTGLGWRIAHDEFREHSSTHGQQFWVVDRLSDTRSDGTICEAVLWDMAGQPDYRLVHALFLDHVDLGLLVFNSTSRERPLGGVDYWARHLRAATSRTAAGSETTAGKKLPGSAPALLVAARSDRGVSTLYKPFQA